MSAPCPCCHDGEVQGRVHVSRQTRLYPGHREVVVTAQTCKCDLEDYEGELFEALEWSEWEAADHAYDRHMDDLMEAREAGFRGPRGLAGEPLRRERNRSQT